MRIGSVSYTHLDVYKRQIQVHAAVVILGGSSGREIHAAAAAQYVGGGGKVGGALGHYRGRQVGGAVSYTHLSPLPRM